MRSISIATLVVLAACAAGASLSGTVSATAQISVGGYAAMDEIPVEGGELRLVVPQVMVVEGAPREVIGFPLKHTGITANVGGMMAVYQVEQVFENPFDAPIEAVYVFPLGDDGAVSGYEIAIGERTVTGEIKSKAEARQIFDEARAAGHTAGIVEQDKPNIFTQRITNIAPREIVKVRIRYVELLDYDNGAYTLAVPLTVGPRYKAQPKVSYVGPAESSSTVSFAAHIDAGVPIVGIESPSHDIVARPLSPTRQEVALGRSDEIPNRDLIVRYRTAGPQTTVGLLAHRVAEQGYFMLAVQPKAHYRTGDIRPREVVVVIDRSGSMDGEPLAQAKRVASAILGTLSERDTFNVIAFANGVDAMSGHAVRGDEQGRRRGLSYLSTLQSGGGTEMQRGVVSMLATSPGSDRIRVVYFLTDGFVGNDDEVVGAARRLLGTNRIFTVGIGSAPNRSLLDRLALAGRGFASYLTLTEPADKLAKALVEKSAYPYLTDIAIDWGGLSVEETTPAHVPDVYAGQPMIVTGRYQRAGTATVTITATAAGQRITIPIAVSLPANNNFEPVASLWARRQIEVLMANKDVEPVGDRITKLGLAFHLVTEYTSFVAVDRTRIVSNGEVRVVEQPALIPEGVNPATTVEHHAPSPSRSTSSRRSRYDDGGGFGGWGGGGHEVGAGWALAFLLLGALWVIARRGA